MSRPNHRKKLTPADRAKRAERNARRGRDSEARRQQNEIELREQRAFSGAVRMIRKRRGLKALREEQMTREVERQLARLGG